MKQGRAFFSAIVENIDPVLIQHAAMYMQPIARLIFKGLGHKAGDQVVFGGYALDQALHHEDLFRRKHRVINVLHVDFVL